MKEWPGGSHIVMKIPPSVYGGNSLIYIGLKCRSQKFLEFRSQKFLGFISMEGSRSTEIVAPYFSHYPET